jgi:hypothetical protein
MTRHEPIEAARRFPRAAGELRALVRAVAPLMVASVAVLLIAFTVGPAEARAVGPGKPATTLQLQMGTTVKLGDHPVARVRLVSGSVPVRGALVSVRLGGQISLQLTTGADGTASGDIARDLSAGRYQATATFAGTPTYQSSASKAVTFTVQPVRLTIATVPATAGIPIVRIGNTTLKTGADGTATATMKDVGKVALRLALPADDATRQLRLDRWDDGSTGAVRTIRIPDTLEVVVALQVRHPVQLSFVASDGGTIDPAKVEVTGVSDDAGNEQALSGPGPHWLASNAINRLTTGLASSPVGYRITQVMVDGQNVVNRGQQRFAVDAPLALKVDVLVFDLTVQGRDALLKSPLGSQVTVIAPSGESQVVELDDASRASIQLPRGEYKLSIGGGPGIPITTPVILSRDQQADVLTISLIDILLVVGIALAVMVGLIVVGRPHVVLRRRKGGSSSGSSGGPGDGQGGGSSAGPSGGSDGGGPGSGGGGPSAPEWPERSPGADWRSPPSS